MAQEEITLYTVQLTGEITLQASDDADAKSKALDYFSEAPQSHLAILQQITVLVDTEET